MFSYKHSHSLLKWPTNSISLTHKTLLHKNNNDTVSNDTCWQSATKKHNKITTGFTCWWRWCWSFCVQDTDSDLWTLHPPAVWSLIAGNTKTPRFYLPTTCGLNLNIIHEHKVTPLFSKTIQGPHWCTKRWILPCGVARCWMTSSWNKDI